MSGTRSASWWTTPPADCSRSPSENRSERGPPRPRSPPRPTCGTSTAQSGGCSLWSRPRYPDLWTGAKGFYKVEPVVADGGEVVLYAPHITEIAAMHPRLVDIGYHCRDFFLAHWERYRDVPLGELAHSTHLFGAGTYDPVAGERQRVRVTLATGIPEATVRQANLGYLAPEAVDVSALGLGPTDVGRARRRRGALPASVGHLDADEPQPAPIQSINGDTWERKEACCTGAR